MDYIASNPGIKPTLVERIRQWFSDPWNVVLVVLVVAGTFFRFKGLTFQSLWLDELFSVGKSHPDMSLYEVIDQFRSGEDPHPPLYFALLHLWFVVFGYAEWSARALAAVAGSFGLITLYWMVKELSNRRCAIIAVAVLVLNSFHLQFSQEVRAYGLVFAWTCLSYTFFSRALNTTKARDLILYALFSVLMIYTHYYGLFVLVAQAAYFLLHLIFRLGKGKEVRLVFRFFLAAVLVGLLYLPWIPVILTNMDRTEFWAQKQDSTFFIRLFQRFFGDEPALSWVAGALLVLGVVYLAMAGLRTKNAKHILNTKQEFETNHKADAVREAEPRHETGAKHQAYAVSGASLPMVLLWIFCCLAIPYYRSVTDVPMLVFRYEIVIFPAVLFLVAVGINVLRHRIAIMLCVSALLVACYVNVFHQKFYFREIRKEQFREASCFVVETNKNMNAQKRTVVMSNVPAFYNVYFELLGSGLRAIQLKNQDGLAATLKQRHGLDINVWVLSGHYKLPAYVPELFNMSGFEQVEAKKLINATATLYMKRK